VERIWFVQLGETASISLMLHTESAMKFMESTLPGQLTSVWVLRLQACFAIYYLDTLVGFEPNE
jgi:hypothetical protein